MTQTKIGASHFKGRLFKSAASSTLALSALAGGVILVGGQAYAEDPNCPGLRKVEYTDLHIDFTDTLEVIQCPTYTNPPGGLVLNSTVALERITNSFYPNPQKQIDTDFNIVPNNGQLSAPAVSIYRLNKTGVDTRTKTPVPVWFDLVGLEIGAGGIGNPSVRKEVFADADLTIKIADILTDRTKTVLAALPNKYDHIWIRDTYNADANNTIDTVFNKFRDVPGPLPVLGAGMALGSVRKLRNLTSRLKVHSMG